MRKALGTTVVVMLGLLVTIVPTGDGRGGYCVPHSAPVARNICVLVG